MRIIAGEAKGHLLERPGGLHTRPTSSLVREAIFSNLECVAPDWSRVLDLYAGTGALGIEALSRRAEWADFVDRSPRCCAIIERNLERTGFSQRAKVYCWDVRKAFSLLNKSYGIIFLDPAYADHSLTSILKELTSSTLVTAETTIVVEHSRRLPVDEYYGRFQLIRELHHGDSYVSIYQFGGDS
jgi:16S rRNA (guanine966-N2)-methyltransferase